jgi:hypothetical protein
VRRLLLSAITIASLTVVAQTPPQKPLRERLLDSALKGDADAQFELGKNYETGRIGLPKDLNEARRWYRAAADQGDPYAEASLGILYNFGKGVTKDLVEAYMWYEIALAHSKREDRDSIQELRNDLAKDMTKQEIAEAQKRARDWKPRPAGEPSPTVR